MTDTLRESNQIPKKCGRTDIANKRGNRAGPSSRGGAAHFSG